MDKASREWRKERGRKRGEKIEGKYNRNKTDEGIKEEGRGRKGGRRIKDRKEERTEKKQREERQTKWSER